MANFSLFNRLSVRTQSKRHEDSAARWLGAITCLIGLLGASAPAVWAASSCSPSGTNATATTCTQNTPITTVSVSGGGVPVAGNVYPSIITVPANTLSGTVTKVVVNLNGLSHTVGQQDLGFLLVSPSGKALVFMGGMGDFTNQAAINISFDDVLGTVPLTSCNFSTPLVNGSVYKTRVCDNTFPSLLGGFPADAGNGWAGCTTNLNCPDAKGPAGTSGLLDLTSVFTQETAPNGNWKLYMRDIGQSPGTGTVASWGLTITTSGVATAATTTSISTVNPSTILRTTPGASDPTAITVVVTSTSPVNGGTVAFTDNGSALACAGGNPTVSANAAFCNATFATEGVHNIQATYSGTAGFAPSSTSGNTFVMVNDRSTLSGVTTTGGQFCNNGAITLPGAGTPSIFPSNMYVTATGSPTGGNAFGGVITGLTVSLNNFSHTFGTLASMLLVSPSGKPYMMMANAFQGGNFGPVNLVLSDAGASFIAQSGAASSGTFKPADYNAGTAQDPASYASRNATALLNPLPAPTTGYFFPGGSGLGSATFGTTFGGDSANGNWRLYAINFADGGNVGAVGSWCLNFAINPTAAATTTAVSANPVQVFTTAPTQATTITATVSSTSTPTGSVTFSDNGTALCSNVALAAGIATCNVPSFSTQGNHNITAAYTPTGSFGPSAGVGVVRVDAHAVKTVLSPTSYQYCNPGTITFPGLNNQAGPSSPYPANIIIPDLPGTIQTTAVVYNNFHVNTGAAARDFTSMLVGPSGGNASTIDLMSRVGGIAENFTATVTLSDAAGSLLPSVAFGSGSYRPTSLGGANTYPALSPAGPFPPPPGPFQYAASNGATTLAGVFSSQIGNGTWSLFSQTVGNGTTGAIGSACLTFVVTPPVLAISKSHVGNFTQGTTGNTYTLQVTNNGPGPTGGTAATVIDDTTTSASGLTITAMSGTNWTCNVGSKTCTSADVVVAGSAYPDITVTVSVAANATTPQTNRATVSGGGATATASASDATTIIQLQTITFPQPADTALGAGPVALTATASSTLTVSYTSNSTAICMVSGASVTLLTVGLCSITANQAGDASYGAAPSVTRTFNVTQLTQTITFPQPADTALNAGPVSLTATASSTLTVSYTSNSTAICMVSGASVTLVTVGLCSITANQAGDASYAAAPSVTRTFNVLANPTITANAGATPQSATINTAFANALAVTVKDAGNNPVPGMNITFTAPGAGASGVFSNSTATITIATNASGVASAPFTANATAGGPYSVTAAATGLTSVSFSLTNLAGAAAAMTANAGTSPQSATINTAFANALAVTVKDAGNNPVPGVNVTFTAPGSGASGVFSNSTATITIATNAAGVASAPFTANATAGGLYSVTAAATGLTTLNFSLSNLAGAAAAMTANAGTSPQSATINTAFVNALAVTVKDAGNNPVAGVNITFTAPGSGASGAFSNSTATITIATNASGVASAAFTANATAGGPYSVTAAATGLTTLNFSLTNLAGAAAAMTANAGTSPQSATINTAFANALAVTVKDAGNNPVAGVNITFTAPGSGASGKFSNLTTTITIPTNAAGVASAPFTANATAGGPYSVTAAATGLTTLNFSLTNLAGAAAAMTANAGTTPQSASINTAFANPLAVTVKDAGNNPVAGVNVTFTAPGSGASGVFSNSTVTITIATNAAGVASAAFIANATAGTPYSVTAAATGLTTLNFSLTNLSGAAFAMTVNAGTTPQTATINTAFLNPLAVTVKDAGNNPVSGVNVKFTAPSSGASGKFSNLTTTITIATNASGVASAPFTANGTSGGPYTVTAAATGLSTVNFLLTNRARAAVLKVPQQYPTISAAVAAALNGDTVAVDGGTYIEQVMINKSIKLVGEPAAVIKAPAVMTGSKAIVLVTGAGVSASIRDLTITGPGGGGCGSIGSGIRVDAGANASIVDNDILDIRDTPFSGCQNGVGIQIGSAADATTGTAVIQDNLITGYQKNGISISNAGSSATVDGNDIRGVGATTVIAQNGIVVAAGAVANVHDNSLRDMIYSPQTVSDAGILAFGAGSGSKFENNKVDNTDTGIYLFSTNGALVANNLSTNSTYDGIAIQTSSNNVVKNNQVARNSRGGAGFGAGVGLYDSASNTISSNNAHDNIDDGFFADAGSINNLFTANVSTVNGAYGYRDQSVGAGTAGTGNTYKKNSAGGNAAGISLPAGLTP